MNAGDLIWLFFIFSALQPMITQRMLELSRKRMIAEIEEKRKSRVILLVHRQETMSFLGFPVFRYIDVNDSEAMLRAIHLTDPEIPLDLILHTPGGLVLASLQIARAIHRHKAKVTVFVPHYAMSGGTLISLGADEIVMAPHAVLGPVDPQFGKFPAASVLRVVAQKPPADMDDETLVMADQAEKAIRQVHDSVFELLQNKLPQDTANQLSKLLSYGTWTHDYPISYEKAKEFGLPVSNQMPNEIMQLMSLFPQPVRTQPSVEYLPAPRTRKAPASSIFSDNY